MSVLPLVPHTDPILREVMPTFDFDGGEDPIQIAKDLCDSCISHGGMGLSANQVGLRHRAFAIMASKMIVCFNPKVVDVSNKEALLDEGCLSFPGISVKVRRPVMIKVRYTQPNGQVVTEKFSGLTARCFLHELSHLDGRTMLDDCSIVQKEKALKKLRKLDRV